jgi:hypothetical protein
MIRRHPRLAAHIREQSFRPPIHPPHRQLRSNHPAAIESRQAAGGQPFFRSLLVAGAVESGRGKARGRRLGRLRLAVLPDAGAGSLEGFLAANVSRPATVATDGWRGYAGLRAKGHAHDPVKLSQSWGGAVLRLPAIHLVFSLAKRWLLGTHHGAVSPRHLPAYLDEHVFRFNRRTAKTISHGFARLIEQAVLTNPTTYRQIVATPAAA